LIEYFFCFGRYPTGRHLRSYLFVRTSQKG
jgi:hypothetical protein